jgi:P27 family predicted phage terminase small subunit
MAKNQEKFPNGMNERTKMAGRKGLSGRKRKPISLLKLSGGYRADRHGGSEVDLPAVVPEPPEFLKDIALDEWKKITSQLLKMKVVTQLDAAALAAYCIEHKKYFEANKKLDETKTMLVKSSKNTVTISPLVRISDRALANMLRICSEFGLTPAARASMRIMAKEIVDESKAKFFKDKA